MQQRREELVVKRAKLEELKRQRLLRQEQFSQGRQNEESSQIYAPTPGRVSRSRDELNDLITSLVDKSRPGSAGPKDAGSGTASAAKASRPNSVLSAADLSVGQSGNASPTAFQPLEGALSPQALSTAPLSTVYEFVPAPAQEVFTYSKGVQTTEPWSPQLQRHSIDDHGGSDGELSPSERKTPRSSKRLSRRDREKDEELRENIRREIEEEARAARGSSLEGLWDPTLGGAVGQQNFPARALTEDELNAVTGSDEFLEFVERSSKVIERALDQEYDILADYALSGANDIDDEDDEVRGGRGKGRRRVREVAQFWDERWSKKRMVSSLDFSPKFPELVLASYTKNPTAPHDPDGLVQVWNLHLHDRPEYVFHAQSDILVAKFSPFHPNLIIGGAYSGQVLLWDTRAKAAPVQKTPLTGSGHTHPVYSVDIVGTQNANNIISCSTDGVVCGWTVDMLAQPQEFINLTTPPPAKVEDLSPTCMAFPRTDPTYFLVGTEEGSIYACHRYDRAGAKAGVDQRVTYRGHAAPVMSVDFHPARGPVDLGDLVLSSSLDWGVKLWRVRVPAATSTTSTAGTPQVTAPILDFTREDVVYDAAWSPVKPGVFALVDGAGALEVWDITLDTEIPVAKVTPTSRRTGSGGAVLGPKSLNKLAWEQHDGKRLATGGLDGSVTVFDVGSELGGVDSARADEWTSVKKLVARLDAGNAGGSGSANGVNGA
ncbi:MAG: hypothetical protein M1832_005469 [Thelocarpon impressellum]|nr:MAG: hypothetical protein M1832_005469 [Thelocarpon impressellum]